ncbi:MAG: molybdenum cofactor guanylyltransferase [Deferribacterales bacterium]
MKNFTIAILAGGMSRRFGQDKAFAEIHGNTFISHIIKKAQRLTDSILVISKDKNKFADFKNINNIEDSLSTQTPLVGILTAMQNSTYNTIFIWSVDAPLVKTEIINTIIDNAGHYDAVVPLIDEKIHPLIACYKKSLVTTLENYLLEGNLKVTEFLSKIDVKYLTKEYFLPFDDHLLSFSNFNTPQELNAIRTIII